MGGIFSSQKQPQAPQPVAAAGVTIQTSCYGKVIPVVFGTAKLAPQLIWYGNFQSQSHTSGGGGGGGGKGGGGGGGSSSTTYTYTAGVQWLLCEGPIQAVGDLWVGGSATGVTAASQGYTTFLGSSPQSGWSYLSSFSTIQEQRTIPSSAPYSITAYYAGAPFTDHGVKDYSGKSFTSVSSITAEGQYSQSSGTYNFGAADAGRDVTLFYNSGNQQPPTEALGYNGFAHIDCAAVSLGSSPSLPNNNVEIYGFYSNSVTGSLDADPSMVVTGILTNPQWGLAPVFPSTLIGSLTAYHSYCIAAGLLISPAYTTQATAASILDDILAYTNSDVAWTGAVLNIIPRGDSALAANGASYTPPSLSFALTDDDLAAINAASGSRGGSTADPVLLSQTRQQGMPNQVTIEILDRANGYNPAPIVAQDLASIQTYGLNPSQSHEAHIFCLAPSARVSAQLMLQRGQIANTYQVTVLHHVIGIDIGDVGTISSASQGLSAITVKVTESSDQSDGTRVLTCEDYLSGVGTALAHATGQALGFQSNYNSDPGPCVTPIVFEPPTQIAATGLEVWLATAGGVSWGGAQVWVCTDNVNYSMVGTITGNARMGVLSATLPAGTDPDTTNTLTVNLTESAGQLLSAVSTADANAFHTLCYCDGELISYQTATLTGANTYALTYLRRGTYGTTIAAHAAGANFARIDQAIFKFNYNKSQIGQTLYIKLLPWNIYGGALYTLPEVTPITHVIQGPPPPPQVTGFTAQQNGGAVAFNWNAITTDSALKGYDIAYGPSGTTNWAAMTLLTEAAAGTEMTNASVAPGSWVFAIRARDIADQLSATMTTVTMNVVNANNVISSANQAPGWPGTLSGFVPHYTGVLIPNSSLLANTVTQAQAAVAQVPSPVAISTYTTAVIDTSQIDQVRLWFTIAAGLCLYGTSNVGTSVSINYSQDGVSWSGWVPWTMGTVQTRYFQMMLTQNNASGPCFIQGFTPIADVASKTCSGTVSAAAGGTTIVFTQTFHVPPLVQCTPSGSGLTGASAINVTKSGCAIHAWTGSTDSGGSVNWSAIGP